MVVKKSTTSRQAGLIAHAPHVHRLKVVGAPVVGAGSAAGAGNGASGGNPFPYGQCTYHAFETRPDIYNTSVANGAPRGGWNGYAWAGFASTYGHLPEGTVPVAGALASISREYFGGPNLDNKGGEYGHVGYVESVNPNGSFQMSERNYAGISAITTHTYWPRAGITFIYGGPAGAGPVSGSGTPPTNGSDPPTSTPPSVHGYEAAFQANTGNLWTVGSADNGDHHLGMMAGTSPSIAVLPSGGYEVAFQANTGNLWTVGSADNGDHQLGMLAGTSPSIAALPSGGYEVAFQANTGNLWTVGSADNGDHKLGMLAGTSPSIVGA
ncbi:MAG: hypothetical protein QOE76_2831 [Frankiales bacterium]|nr:hypothetical protein [Frankiales bacterium]